MTGTDDQDGATYAAHMLVGHELVGGWRVIEKLQPRDDATGGHFSVGYIVENDESARRGFLKALDYSSVLEREPEVDPALVLQAMTAAYLFEVNLLERCGRLDRIVRALGHGVVSVDGTRRGVAAVNYLIFELADGDIRAAIDASDQMDLAWMFRTLHHVAKGLSQLHGRGIAHQDLKPSNVLTFGPHDTKLSDLGRASAVDTAAVHDSYDFAGDPTYAPPELLYGEVSPDWHSRRSACDLYLLGSLAVFLFSWGALTQNVLRRLTPDQQPGIWRDGYRTVLPYVREAFEDVLSDFGEELADDVSQTLVPIVRYLAEPDPELRGHPRARRSRGNRYSLERIVAELDLCARRAETGALRSAA